MNKDTKQTAGEAPAIRHAAAVSDGGSTYVITFVSSTAPVSLEAPNAPELGGLAVFRSRRTEDGRDRFRLHIGFFSSMEAAEEMLPVVRRSHPAAFVTTAPQSNMGSLDDTATASFSIIRPTEPEIDAPTAIAAAALRQQSSRAPIRDSAPAATAAPTAAAPAGRAAEPAAPSPTAAAPAGPTAVPAAPSPAASAATVDEPAAAREVQRYAVQLLWSKEPIDLSKIRRFAIFSGYLLYAVETRSSGRKMYGVRIGFYVDAISAGLVARYVKPAFKNAAVVPVSEGEHARASTAAISLTSVISAGGRSAAACWPAAAVAVDFMSGTQGRQSVTL